VKKLFPYGKKPLLDYQLIVVNILLLTVKEQNAFMKNRVFTKILNGNSVFQKWLSNGGG